MGLGECIVAIVSIICATFLGICWIYEDDVKKKNKRK